MKFPLRVLALFPVLFLTIACATASPTPIPTPDIPATVAAQVQAQLATIPTPTVISTATPYPTHTPYPTATPFPPLPTSTPYPTATPRPTYTPYPTPTPTNTPAPTPTNTPIPTPTATPTRTPRPTATPTATPIPNLTGEWLTWSEVKALGFESDKNNPPRIILYADDFSRSNGSLHIDCQRDDGRLFLEVYVKWRELLVIAQPFGSPPDRKVEYAIDGAWRPARFWAPGISDDERIRAVFPYPAQREDIISGLKKGGSQLIFRVYKPYSTSEQFTAYKFNTEGFKKAFEPVEWACGQP